MTLPVDDNPLSDLHLAPLVPPPAPPQSHRGPPAPRRLRDVLASSMSTYLPALLMALLALSTWWLVKYTPMFTPPKPVAPPRHEPDYTMNQFALQRFAPDGRLRLSIEGDVMRHYPDTDTLEIDGVRLQGYAADGRLTTATARQAISNADGSEIQLLGGANVVSAGANGADPIEFNGDFLHVFTRTERLRSHLPVNVRRSGSEFRAGGFEYNNLTRRVEFSGPVQAQFAAPAKTLPPKRRPQ